MKFSVITLLLALLNTHSVFAAEDEVEVRELNWVNSSFLANQRVLVDELTRRHFGTPVRGNSSDLHTLQRLIDKEVVPRDDTGTLQALGVVLGDVFVNENKPLEWRVLEDELGMSHAVCVIDTTQCLFPVTMLSRRIEVGLNPRVQKVYEDGLAMIKAWFPKRPFAD